MDWNEFRDNLETCAKSGLTIEQAAQEMGYELKKFRQNYQSFLIKIKNRAQKIAVQRFNQRKPDCSLEYYVKETIKATQEKYKLVGQKGRKADNIDFDIVEPDLT